MNIKNRTILSLLTLIFVLVTSFFYLNKALAFHFVDEEYNFNFGNEILKGEKIYREQFSNHQPLAFIMSAGIQKISHPNSIYLLVKRHRLAMLIYSAIGSVLLVIALEVPALLFVVIYEFSKIFLLGNLFLPESLVVYPLIYLLSLVFVKEAILRNWEYVVAGFLMAFIFFLLSPLWPLLVVIFFYLLWKAQSRLKSVLLLLAGALPIGILVSFFIDPLGYLHQSVYINLFYFIPLTANGSTLLSFLKGFSTPFIALFSPVSNSPSFTIIWVLSILFILGIIRFVIKREFVVALAYILFLGLANLRFIQPGMQYYSGFHLLPWFACLIFLVSIMAVNIYSKEIKWFLKFTAVFLILLAITFSLKGAMTSLFPRSNEALDLYVNYSNQTTLGETIKIMSEGNRGQSLFVAPDEWLIYWQSGLVPPMQINSYYSWMDKTPELDEEISRMFADKPPTYFYCDCSPNLSIYKYLGGYQRLFENNKPTALYVKADVLKSLNREKRQKLRFYNFNLDQ